MNRLSDRVKKAGFSTTMQIAALAFKLQSEGIKIINLNVGEPDFNTPENVKSAAHIAIYKNFTKYTPNAGLAELKDAIIKRLKTDYDLSYTRDEIIVSPGAKNCVYNACMAVINPGDEVIIPTPYWVSYPAMVRLAAGIPIFLPTFANDGFRLAPDLLEQAITPRTRALILNNPSNPAGAFYSREDLAELLEVALAANLIIIADEVYEKLIYDDLKFTPAAAISTKAKENTVLISGVSKTYAMTGWRIGYAAASKDLIAGMNMVQSHNTSGATSISQVAGIEALNGPQDCVKTMLAEFQKRRDYLLARLRQIPGITCHPASGAFYLFPDFSAYFNMEFEGGRIMNSADMVYYLLKQAYVATVPGSGFGAENYIRLAYSTSLENIETAMNQIEAALKKLSPIRQLEIK
jgi:aspartate/methionine/tyrosine aminotransferase